MRLPLTSKVICAQLVSDVCLNLLLENTWNNFLKFANTKMHK